METREELEIPEELKKHPENKKYPNGPYSEKQIETIIEKLGELPDGRFAKRRIGKLKEQTEKGVITLDEIFPPEKSSEGDILQPKLYAFLKANGTYYAIFNKIGRGATGKVKLAYDILHGKLYTLKTLEPPSANEIPEIRMIAEREKEALIAMNRGFAFIERTINRGKENLQINILMEYFPGESLSNYKGNLSHLNGLRAGVSMFTEVKTLFAKGFYHNDLKSSNMIYNPKNQTVHVIDFGSVARYSTDEKIIKKSPGGTLEYYAPERKETNISTEKSEVYSLGVILGETMGFAKIERKGFTAKVIFKDEESILEENRKTYELVKRMLDPHPDKRPTFDESLKELNVLLEVAELKPKTKQKKVTFFEEPRKPIPIPRVSSDTTLVKESLKPIRRVLSDQSLLSTTQKPQTAKNIDWDSLKQNILSGLEAVKNKTKHKKECDELINILLNPNEKVAYFKVQNVINKMITVFNKKCSKYGKKPINEINTHKDKHDFTRGIGSILLDLANDKELTALLKVHELDIKNKTAVSGNLDELQPGITISKTTTMQKKKKDF